MSELVSTNPGTGEVVGTVAVTPVDQIPAVVARARAAQPAWAALSFEERAARLREAGALIEARHEHIGSLGSQEMGKPIRECQGEAKWVGKGLADELTEMGEAFADEVIENDRMSTRVHRDPHGVAVCIAPWNFPILMPHTQVLPALAAGNTVILKPSEQSPLTAQAYAECLMECLPEGVLQVVHGDEAQGKALVSADGVDLVVFTGSRAAGVHILGEASKQLKRVILELGGKDPLVVLPDADLDRAASFAARNSFRNAGQVCVSTERIYVHADVHDAFVDKLVAEAQAMTVGPQAEASTKVGPMVDGRQKAHVVGQVDRAVASGAKVAWRGAHNEGNFLAPVVLTDLDDAMDIARDETFGPVACVFKVADDAEAVRRANDTPYGLGAVVYGAPDRAHQVARQLTAGMIGVNQGIGSAGSTPWVGARQSGYGFHSGKEGHRQFAQVRVVTVAR